MPCYQETIIGSQRSQLQPKTKDILAKCGGRVWKVGSFCETHQKIILIISMQKVSNSSSVSDKEDDIATTLTK